MKCLFRSSYHSTGGFVVGQPRGEDPYVNDHANCTVVSMDYRIV